jgi:hypothetical protein
MPLMGIGHKNVTKECLKNHNPRRNNKRMGAKN